MKCCPNPDCTEHRKENSRGKFCLECGQMLADLQLAVPHCQNVECPNARPSAELKGRFCQECGERIVIPSTSRSEPYGVKPAPTSSKSSADITVRTSASALTDSSSGNEAPRWTDAAQTPCNPVREMSKAAWDNCGILGEAPTLTGSEDVLARLDTLLGLVPTPSGEPPTTPRPTGMKTEESKIKPNTTDIPGSPMENKEDRYVAMSVEELKGILRKRDDTEALYTLAMRYTEGLSVEQNTAEAFKLLEKAAQRGSAKAQRELGSRFVSTTDEERNVKEAVKWLAKAAEQDDSEAQFKLALLYWTQFGNRSHFHSAGDSDQLFFKGLKRYHIDQMTGRHDHGIKLNDAETVRWAQKATEKDYPRAWLLLGYCHEYGAGITQEDALKALDCFRRAADQGDPDAQYQLACYYSSAIGVAEDRGQAVAWAEKSAIQNHVAAQRFLGMAYREGNGVEQDYEKAVEWFKKSAEQRDVRSMYLLGISFHQGIGMDQDHSQAFEWIRRAARQDDPEAQLALGTLYQNGEGVQKNVSEGAKWYLKASDRGSDGHLGLAEAQYKLGCCYYAAEGVFYDIDAAKLWFSRAADKGHTLAKKALVTKNFQK